MLYHNPRPVWLRVLREAFYIIYNPLKKLYLFLFRPVTKGVKMIVINKDRILLLRIGYAGRKWVIPGGMVDNGESFETAARRELKEESGLEIGEVESIGSLYSEREYKKDTVQYLVGETGSEDLVIDDQEIIDAGWFAFDELPEERSVVVDKGIKLYNDWKHGKN